MELGAAPDRPGRMTGQRNKVHSVTTIDRVAKELGEDEDWLWDIAVGMEPEDGLIWVYTLNGDGIMAFSDVGVDSLQDLIAIHRNERP
jgi:hypothetical protein